MKISALSIRSEQSQSCVRECRTRPVNPDEGVLFRCEYREYEIESRSCHDTRRAREIMFRDAVNPSLEAAGNASLRFPPPHMISRARPSLWQIHLLQQRLITRVAAQTAEIRRDLDPREARISMPIGAFRPHERKVRLAAPGICSGDFPIALPRLGNLLHLVEKSPGLIEVSE